MEKKTKSTLTSITFILISLGIFFWGVVIAKPFLAPIVIAVLLVLVFLPVASWFEKKGIKRVWSSFFSTLMVLLFFAIVSGVVGLQIKQFVQEWPEIQEKMKPEVEKLMQYIEDKTGITVQELKISSYLPQEENTEADSEQAQNQPQDNSTDKGEGILNSAGNVIFGVFGFFGSFLLTMVYIFFFLLYRKKFSDSILKMVSDTNRENTKKILSESANISQHYLFGRLILIVFLSVIYSIGLMISGVQQAILISILAAILTLIPYIGNIIGYTLALGMALFSGSGGTGIIGVTITFALTQFVESYILEPYIVGDQVDINPVFTILAVVFGDAIWGVTGMLIAIPVLGIAKVIFDRITYLQPIGYLLGGEDIGNGNNKNNIFTKIQNWSSGKSGKIQNK